MVVSRFAAVCLLALQIAIPAYQLLKPRPARFGWQMFAGISQPLEFFVGFGDGRVERVDLARYFGRVRSDMTLTNDLPPILCAHLPNSREVSYRLIGERTPHIHRCDN